MSRIKSTTMREKLDLSISERDFQQSVIDLAHQYGWLCYHTYDSRRSVAGFPDLVMVRDWILFIELKSEKGRLSEQQKVWIHKLSNTAIVKVYRPGDWDKIVELLK